MKQLTALDLALIVKELQFLMNGKIDNIYQASGEELYFNIFKTGEGKSVLRITPSLLYITSIKKETDNFNFCRFLRKRLLNAYIKKIYQHEFERVVIFELEAKDIKYNLIIEFFSKGNIILCDNDFKIISPLKQQKWKDRNILPKLKYEFPPVQGTNLFILDYDSFKEIILKSKKLIVKTLAMDLSLSGLYAEEILKQVKIDKDKTELKDKELKKLFSVVEDVRKLDLKFILKTNNLSVNSDSFNQALDDLYSDEIVKEEKQKVDDRKGKEVEKVEKVLKQQQEALKRIKEGVEENTNKANYIYEHYTEIKALLDDIKDMRKKKISWDEIKKKYPKIKEKKGFVMISHSP